jgi:hypothetical protein
MAHDENIEPGSSPNLAGPAGFRLRRVNAAVETFLDAATDACAVLADLGFALPYVKWLEYHAIPLVEDYEVQIEECEDSAEEVVKLLQELKDEAAALADLLLFLDHIAVGIEEQIGQDAIAAVKAEIARFIAAKLAPVRETGRQLCDLLCDLQDASSEAE